MADIVWDGKTSALADIREVRPWLWMEKRRIAVGFFFLLVSQAVGLYLPMLNRRVFDEILPARDLRALAFLSLVLFGLGCVEFGCRSVNQFFFNVAAERTAARLRTALFDKLTRMSYRWYETFAKGDLHDILTADANNVRLLYLDRIAGLGTQIMSGVTCLYLTFALNVRLSLICLAFVGLASLCVLAANRKIHAAASAFTRCRSRLHSSMFDMLTFMPLIKMCCAEKKESERYSALTGDLARSTVAMEQTVVLASGLIETVQSLTPFVILLVGVFLMIRGELLLGELLAFSMYFTRLRASVTTFTSLSWQWQKARPSLCRLATVLRAPDEDIVGKARVTDIVRGIEASDISLCLGGRRILDHVSLRIPRGAVVAVVGHNGSGKSTLLKVLSGLLAPDTGGVLVDGAPLDTLEKASYRRLCGFVFQNAMSLNRTIRETVSYRCETSVAGEDLYRMLDRVGLRELVSHLPAGLDTLLGEMSQSVSGGEMQRLAIARELMGKPRVLFLDEATSSIDAAGESSLLTFLVRESRETGLSVVYVTHYLATLGFADLVYVVKNGAVYESGTPDDLAKSGACFQECLVKGDTEDSGPDTQGSHDGLPGRDGLSRQGPGRRVKGSTR